MANNMKSATFCKATWAIFLVALAILVQLKGSEAQAGGCASQLGNLNVCAPYVVPGAVNTNPSQECCAALSGVNHDCMCNTLRVASQLPSSCNLAALNCGN
ncbi:protein MEN-8 [Silene latifolia]|uniref:Protein MEN-8 n=1 Tax=Silene latifolia TaxID=37657 RepID=MEN8_SILLA|nr:RecName: Full=Protein MEN-8; Flags: Precursor [Silene latifolia]CAA70033.1 Men-8 [Silene latifolia]